MRRSGHAGRLLALTGAVLAVIVLGAACGQYPGVHSETVANQQPAVASAPQPPSSPVSGVESDPSSTTSTTTTTAKKSHADGAQGPGKDAVQGGDQSVDLSRVFAVNHARKDGAGKHASGTGDTKTGSSSGPKQGSTDSKSGTNSAKTSTSSKSSKGTSKTGKGISGDDGAKPGKPDIKGKITPGQVPTGGSLDLATVISHETVAGAKYNSTILPKGFPMFICPVQGRYSYSDGYGAPRYAGGYHPHAGVDIFADQGTPIVAPFDGYVERDPNTLGGNAVIVRGAQGYVYMAHLVAYGITDRNVSAGTVVGFVGNTGDAQGTSYHDHFEWHPNHVADYDRVIAATNGAVDPFPYLQVVCPPD